MRNQIVSRGNYWIMVRGKGASVSRPWFKLDFFINIWSQLMMSLADIEVWENYINASTHIHKTWWVNLVIPRNVRVVVCFYIVHSHWLSNRKRFNELPCGVMALIYTSHWSILTESKHSHQPKIEYFNIFTIEGGGAVRRIFWGGHPSNKIGKCRQKANSCRCKKCFYQTKLDFRLVSREHLGHQSSGVFFLY